MPKLLPDIPFSTPFGRVHFPQPELPPVRLAFNIDARRREALVQGFGADGSKVLGLIPVVGEFLADAVQDTHRGEIRRMLTTQEMDSFVKYTKVSPFDSLALLRTFLKEDIFGATPP